MDIPQFAMGINWDGVPPTPEQWDALEGHAFEHLEDIKGVQVAISTRAMLELLRCMGQPQTPSANLTKPQMAALIIGEPVPHEEWAMPEQGNAHLASSSRDSSYLPSLVFGLELTLEPQFVCSSQPEVSPWQLRMGPRMRRHSQMLMQLPPSSYQAHPTSQQFWRPYSRGSLSREL